MNNEIRNPHQDTWKALVLFLAEIAKSKSITQEVIAERTGLQRSNVSRMFQLRYCPSLDNWLKILKAVEVNIFFEDRDSKTDLNLLFEKAMTELGRRPENIPKN
ncbi:helix-turn-helix domain-containing protein [Mangrovibacterium sp.]|uniref:helix-turn-helix domain-containing protein n=1 Tax=Mangrovibacterium sp. TaxID=1961364 RepID=UPI00356A1036